MQVNTTSPHKTIIANIILADISEFKCKQGIFMDDVLGMFFIFMLTAYSLPEIF